jgi:hypothetical protein
MMLRTLRRPDIVGHTISRVLQTASQPSEPWQHLGDGRESSVCDVFVVLDDCSSFLLDICSRAIKVAEIDPESLIPAEFLGLEKCSQGTVLDSVIGTRIFEVVIGTLGVALVLSNSKLLSAGLLIDDHGTG